MANLKKLLAVRDGLKAQGSLLTSGGIGAALIGAFTSAPILAPIGILAGAYGLWKGRSSDGLDANIETAIQEAFNAIFLENPGTKDTVLQILLSLTDSNGKSIVRDLRDLSIITGRELSTLAETIELLLRYNLVIKTSESEDTYTVHELVAYLVLNKLKETLQSRPLM